MTKREKLKEMIKAKYVEQIRDYMDSERFFKELAEATKRPATKLLEDYLVSTEIEFNSIYNKVDSLSIKEVNCLLRVMNYGEIES